MAYKMNRKGMAEMLVAPFMIVEMEERARKVEVRAIVIAPEQSGEYKTHFSVESGVKTSSKGTRRAYGRVINDDEKARYLEYGTEDTPRFRTLGKALDAAGG